MNNVNNLTACQNRAMNLLLQRQNIFLSGSAGTGKSYVIKQFYESYQGNIVCVAPTGVAATNLGCNAVTIHRFFKLNTNPAFWDLDMTSGLMEKLGAVDAIVVDEVSMVDSRLLTQMMIMLLIASKEANKPMPHLIFVGDYGQLLPVVPSEQEEQYLTARYGGKLAFESQAWRCANLTPVHLSEVVRQSGDPLHADMLNHFRVNDLISPVHYDQYGNQLNALAAFNGNVTITPTPPQGAVILCNTNRDVHHYNNIAENNITDQPTEFCAVITGDVERDEWPTEYCLKLKVGSRVMFVRNQADATETGFLYVNGDLGTVMLIDYTKKEVIVQLDKSGQSITVGPKMWEINDVEVHIDEDQQTSLKPVLVGQFIQIPLKLAHAMTVHKSQGLTLPSVHYHRGSGAFAHGQAFVAVSRTPSLDCMSISTALTGSDFIMDPTVNEFNQQVLQYGNQATPTPAALLDPPAWSSILPPPLDGGDDIQQSYNGEVNPIVDIPATTIGFETRMIYDDGQLIVRSRVWDSDADAS